MADNYRNKLFSAEKKIIQKSGGPLQPSGHSAIHTQEVLNAIAEVKKLIEQSSSSTPQSVADMPEMTVLRGQLHDLKDSIDKTKSEIAAIHRPGEQEDKFVSAALELSAIVNATEEATNNILGAAEDIEDLAQQLRDRLDDVKALEAVNKISELVIGIFENCNFQDITGQRTSKVVKTINYLEDRILTMINIWGEEEFKGIELPEDARSDDEKLLEGPQLSGQGISQNDIDSLFD